MTAAKTNPGHFFEDFSLGQVFAHATPRTIASGDVALYTGLYGPRFAVQSSDEFARSLGYPRAPVDDLIVFHTVFGKTVPDISLNAIANLGYAECRFLAPVYPGDTLSAASEVIGLRENSNRVSGVVYVRTSGRNQRGGVASSAQSSQQNATAVHSIRLSSISGASLRAPAMRSSSTLLRNSMKLPTIA